MSIKKLGQHHFRVDLNSSNMTYISKTVMDILLANLKEKCVTGELLHYKQIEDKIKSVFPKSVLSVNEKLNQACEQALKQIPRNSNRQNLFGRALVQKIIIYPKTKPEWLDWFKLNYLIPFLEQVRISMGIQNFDYFNELLDIALQNECMIRDLEQAHIDWTTFFSHKRVSLMLTKARKLRQWVCILNNQDIFLNAINSKVTEGVRKFSSKDLWHILDSWEFEEDE